jgi:hypothetical protein
VFRHDVARGPVPRWRMICGIELGSRSIVGGPAGARASQAVAGEIDPVGVVDEAIEDGIGVGGIADQLVPLALPRALLKSEATAAID